MLGACLGWSVVEEKGGVRDECVREVEGGFCCDGRSWL